MPLAAPLEGSSPATAPPSVLAQLFVPSHPAHELCRRADAMAITCDVRATSRGLWPSVVWRSAHQLKPLRASSEPASEGMNERIAAVQAV